MKKKVLEKVQLVVFIILVGLALIFKDNAQTCFILFGSYYLFVFLSGIVIHIASMNDVDEISDEVEKDTAELLDKKMRLQDKISNVGSLVMAVVLWYNLSVAFIPLDESEVQSLHAIGSEIPLICTIFSVFLIMYILSEIVDGVVTFIKSHLFEEKAIAIKNTIQEVGIYVFMIVIVASVTLGVYYVSWNWGKLITEDELIVKHLWNEKAYSWETMEYYTYDVEANILMVTFEDDEEFKIKLMDSLDEATETLYDKYDGYSAFTDYLFCEKYTHIEHEIIK